MALDFDQYTISEMASRLELTTTLLELAKTHLPEGEEKKELEDALVKNKEVIQKSKQRLNANVQCPTSFCPY
jgi:hypothetical protein